MNIRPIRTDADYHAALSRIDDLWGAETGTADGDELDVLITLVEVYEGKHHTVPPADPIEAIIFMMQQKGMKAGDLAPFIGSKARVSEVLNRKRPLTLAMVRALSKGLGIPIDTLAREYQNLGCEGDEVDYSRFPVREIVKFGLVQGFDAKSQAEEIMRDIIARSGSDSCFGHAANFRQSIRRSGKDDPYAAQAWLLCAKAAANQDRPVVPFNGIDRGFLHQIAQLSLLHDGPRQAVEHLKSKGIGMVVVRHLNRTYLDGAAFTLKDGRPVVALTLRHDRIDYFWFTLMHELAHVMLGHLGSEPGAVIVDDLDLAPGDEMEQAADTTAQEALIPSAAWEASPLTRVRSLSNVKKLAWDLRIHPALVAGRIRKETGNFRIFSREVGQGEVRRHFGDSPGL